MKYDAAWAELRKHYRKEVMRVLREIASGSIEEIDLERLHTFCQTSLALMSKVNEGTWRSAERQMEIMDLLHTFEQGETENDKSTSNPAVLGDSATLDGVAYLTSTKDRRGGVGGSSRDSYAMPWESLG